MADRYQDRSYGAGGHGRGGDQYESDRDESDPLAELARLIGQTDPFGTTGRANQPVSPRPAPRQETPQDYRQDYRQEYREDYQSAPEPEEAPAPQSPPAWMQRANHRREAQRETSRTSRETPTQFAREIPDTPEAESEDHLAAVHPLHRHAAHPQETQADRYYRDEQAYQHEAAYAETEEELDPSRYDNALYGQLESGAQDFQREPSYPDDPYAYQGEYEEEPVKRRRSPMLAVIAVLILGVVGTAAAYAYRTYFSPVRSGEPPIIKADNGPTKIVPAQSDNSAKVPDRMVTGDGTEKIVPREEQPVDVNSRAAGPRVVFPPLNQNANPPAAASVTPNAMPSMPPAGAAGAAPANNGTLPNSEPRKVRTFSVHGDQPDASAMPVNPPPAPPAAAAKPGAAAPKPAKTQLTQANASASGPLSLAPQAQPSAPADAGTRVAAAAPTQIAPSSPPAGGGAYMVQVSSQRNEADAQASFRALQNKFPSVLGSQSPVIRKADLGDKGVYYRAMVGPFGTSEEAAQLCGNLKNAGGQCIVQRN